MASLSDISIVEICDCPLVLIVDDEPFNLIALEGILYQLENILVDKAFNGEIALELLVKNNSNESCCRNHKPYKMVILDKYMPVRCGISTAQMIR